MGGCGWLLMWLVYVEMVVATMAMVGIFVRFKVGCAIHFSVGISIKIRISTCFALEKNPRGIFLRDEVRSYIQ